MENIVEIFKKHKHLIAFGISISIILFSFVFIFSLQDNNTFFLKDIEGDRNVLSDLIITAYLQDQWHGQKIRIEKGRLSHKFEYYENEDDMHMPPIKYGNGATDDKYSYWYYYSYEIASDANTRTEYSENKVELPLNNGTTIEATEKITTIYADKIDIYMSVNVNWPLWSKDRKKGEPDKSRLKFKTGMALIRDEMDFKFERKITSYSGGGHSEQELNFKNRDLVQPYYGNFALTTLKDKQYFTVPNQDTELSGENGIFMAVEYVDTITFLLNGGKEYGKVKKLVNFNLEEENIRILGLHVVEDNLVLVMLVNDILTFRAYDPNDGKLLAELAVPEFDIPNPLEIIYYTPYIHENTMSLSFIGLNPSYYQNGILNRPDYFSIVSVKLESTDDTSTDNVNTNNITADTSQPADIGSNTRKTKIELLYCINRFKLNNTKLNNVVVSEVSAVVPVNNKLVVFAVLREGQSNEVTTANENLYPSHFTIFIFGKKQDSFVKSQDSSEMMQQTMNKFSELLYAGEIITDAKDDILSQSNSYYENRNIELVTVKGAENND